MSPDREVEINSASVIMHAAETNQTRIDPSCLSAATSFCVSCCGRLVDARARRYPNTSGHAMMTHVAK